MFCAPKTRLLALLLATTVVAACTHQILAEPGVDVAEITFDKTPIERGLTFNRDGKHIEPGVAPVKDGDQKLQTWAAREGNVPEAGWMRRILLKFTDESFRDGQRPAVDIEVTYALDTWAGVEFRADTAQGDQKVSSGWGGKPHLKTKRFQIDDAQFAGGVADGWDLSIAGANAPLHLRSVKVIGYDPERNVRWDRMLRIGKVRSDQPAGVLAFPRGEGQTLNVDMRNLAFVDRPIHYRLTVEDLDGQTVHDDTGELVLKGSEQRDLSLTFNTSDWQLGPYTASLTLRLEPSADPVLDRELSLGVISDIQLAKARDDEFYFGLDAANNHARDSGDDAAMVWYDLMGVDMLRSLPVRAPYDAKRIAVGVERLEQGNLRSSLMMDPAKPNDGDQYNQRKLMRERTELIVNAIKEHGGRSPGHIHAVELGNEPDLPFFWPGPIDLYVERMEQMADALHGAMNSSGLERGEDVYVMNGGLSFAGPKGDRRSREFLKKVNPSKLDAIAYHGHGPGIEAERMAYERDRAAANDAGITDLPLVETESGFAANNAAGRMEQARTVVEKMLYGQSVGQPFFFYFRLYMDNDGGYGMTQNRVEPMPSLLAYRHMVERLRHHRFVQELQLPEAMRDAGVIAYVFEEVDAEREPTGKRSLVAWTTEPAGRDLMIELPGGEELRSFDLFGNAREVPRAGGRTVRLSVGVDPIYLAWAGEAAADWPQITDALITLADEPHVIAGGSNRLSVRVSNPADSGASLTVQAEADLRVGASVSPTQTTLDLLAGGSDEVALNIEVGSAEAPLDMPSWWTLFVDADPGAMNRRQWASIPETLRGPQGVVRPTYAVVEDGRLNFAEIAGGFAEQRPVVGYATLDSPAEVELPVAASADWWMAWYVNGEQVYSTLETGNRHGSIADHTFELPLKSGRNVIAFVVLSGSAGWSVDLAGPAERYLAQNPGQPLDRLSLRLLDGDHEVAAQHVPLQLVGPVPALGDGVGAEDLDDWLPLEPLAVLGAEAVTNRYTDQPDASRWYQGEADLSAIAWLRDDGGALRLMVAVRDDQHEPVAGQIPSDEADALRLVFADRAGAVLHEQTLTDAKRTAMPDGERVTLYTAAMTPDAPGDDVFRLSLRLTDRDGGVMKQTLDLGDVAEPTRGVLLHRPTTD